MSAKIQQEEPAYSGNIDEDNFSNGKSTDAKKIKGGLSRQFKLISVNFKEAALDSPSFRATVNHLDLQIDNIEQWVTALKSSCRKVPSFLNDIQSFYNSFLEHLVPTFLQDGLIDQEYTVQSLHTTLGGLKRLWGFSLSALAINSNAIDNLYTVISGNISHYKDLRKKFDQSQAKYERYLTTYMATSKVKDSPMVMEDAVQLYKAKQDYVSLSLDLIIELANLGNTLDRLLVNMSTSLWKNKQMTMVDAFDSYFTQAWSKITKIQGWSDSYSVAMDKLKADMIAARNQVEDSTYLQMKPSDNPNDYRTSLINNHLLADIDEASFEKHGYLFMKTWSKSTKPIWVRRWVFIKGGVLGMLVLSPSQTFVQETDKIGILLCNVKYYPNEDRRFCFELKTNEITIIFQAESLLELKSWLKVIENERNRIIQNSAEDQELFTIASGRYPPIISEFASTVNTTVDRELTNTKITNAAGQVVMSSNLSTHIAKHEKYFEKHIYYQIPLFRPPFMTGTTKTSIIAYSLTKATAIPTALTANIWGSVNWGIYYLHDALERDISLGNDVDLESSITCDGAYDEPGINYPEYYPKDLVPVDIQMRALFETAVEPGDYCLVSFRCIWSPNSKQELSGRCFITSTHIYFYMLALGFVALFKDPVNRMVSVDYTPQTQYDQLKIYSVSGVIKLKLFLDDGKLIKQKLLCLINNRASDKPKSLPDLIAELNKIEIQIKEENDDSKQLSIIKSLCNNVINKEGILEIMHGYSHNQLAPGANSSIRLTKGVGTQFQTDFGQEYTYMSVGTYRLPPKALFHALVGDDSTILRDQGMFAKYHSIVKEPWRRSADGNLFRIFNTAAVYNNTKALIQVSQVIDNMFDDEYYTISQTKSKFQFFLGSKFHVEYKYVIIGVAGKKSKVYFYVRRIFDKNLFFNFFTSWLTKTLTFSLGSHFHKLLKGVEEEIGTHGMVAKSVYLYGKLSITDTENKEDNAPLVYFSLADILVVIGERITYQIIKFLIYLVKLFEKGVRKFVKDYLLIGLCLLSVLLNLFLVGRSTVSYWSVRRADQVAYDFVTKDPVQLRRAVYLQDTVDMLSKNQFDFGLNEGQEASKCFEKFKKQSFIINYDQLEVWNDSYADKATKEMAQTLKQNMWDIGVKRHDLMVQLKILNQMERELGLAEWKNWLMSELKRCEFIKSLVFNPINESQDLYDEMGEGIASVIQYCTDCTDQLKYLDLI